MDHPNVVSLRDDDKKRCWFLSFLEVKKNTSEISTLPKTNLQGKKWVMLLVLYRFFGGAIYFLHESKELFLVRC